jgi:hypothetical protein
VSVDADHRLERADVVRIALRVTSLLAAPASET